MAVAAILEPPGHDHPLRFPALDRFLTGILTLVLGLLVPLAAAAREIERSGPADAGGAQFAATLRALRSGVDAAITSDERQRAFARAVAEQEAALVASPAPERAVRRAAAASAVALMQQQLDLLTASEVLWTSGPLHRAVLTDGDARAQALQRLSDFDAAIAKVCVYEHEVETQLSANLARFDVPDAQREPMLRSVRADARRQGRGLSAQLVPMIGYSRALHGLYDFLERVHGQWSLDAAGTIVAASGVAEELAQRVREVRAAQGVLLGEG